MVNLANGLAGRGHDVDFVVARLSGPYNGSVSEGVRVRSLSGRLSGAIPPLVKYIRANRPASILAAGEHACAVAVVARCLSHCQTRLVLSLHNAIRPERMARKGLKERANPALVRLFYPAAEQIVTVSEELRREALRLIGGRASKFVAIYNPLFSDKLARCAEAPTGHPWLERKDAPVVVAAGRLTPQKGFDTLLRAIALVRRRLSVRLLVLGEGPERSSLAALSNELGIAAAVAFPGFVANPYAYMRRSDVLAMSSRWEGFGNVLVEAMASGTQVVSTDCPYGPREILAGGKYGALVPVDDPVALADAIVYKIHHPLPVSLLASRASEFSIDRALDLYEGVLGLTA
jgi:glycosyltransferase involved in cell wall biosynthesis